MDISIICPLYNAEMYLRDLNKKIKRQKNVDIKSISYVLTESRDNTENILKEINASYKTVKSEEFSHSKIREEAAFETEGDIIVFITQDAIITDDFWLHNLVEPIIKGEVQASFSRQICDNNTIEKYIREKNYPENSRVVSKDDINKLGILTFFYSDVSSAVRRDIYVELKGYDGKDLITNEDMYFAHKLINSGYKIKYCADSVVIHSHKFTLSQLFKRYFDTGVFLKQNSYLLQYGANESAVALLKYTLKRAVAEKNYGVIMNIIPNFAARYIGSKLGKIYDILPENLRIKFSSSKSYWINNKLTHK